MKNTPIIQHYVPQFLIRNFCSGKKKQINVFEKASGKSFVSNTKNIASERNFYNYIDKGEPKTLEFMLSEYESKVKPIIDKLLETQSFLSINKIEHQLLSQFIALQLLRTKTQREQLKAISTYCFNNFEKLGFISPKDENYENELKLVISNLINKNLEKFAQIIYKKNWFLITNQSNQSFCICDNPITMYNENYNPLIGNIGIEVDGIQIYLPISPKVTLAIYCESLREKISYLKRIPNYNLDGKTLLGAIEKSSYWDAPEEVITFLNGLQTCFSERYIFSKTGDFSLYVKQIQDNPSLKQGPRSSIL